MNDFPVGISKTIYRPSQISSLEWIDDKEGFMERQEKYKTQLRTKIDTYKLFIEKDPSRSKVNERIEMLENIRKIYGKIMVEPSREVMYEMPFFDLEIEKLKNEQVVMEFLNEIRNPGGIFGNELYEMGKGSPFEFLLEFDKQATELHSDFVRGFALTFMNEGKQAHTYYEVFKADPARAKSIVSDSMKILWDMDIRKNWPQIQEILEIFSSDFWKKLQASDGGYAAFLGGQVLGLIAISMMTGSLSGIKKLGKLVKFIGLAGMTGKRVEMKYVATLSDGYELLTNPQFHEEILKLFHKKLPELGLVNLREGVEAMIRFIISLPPDKQSEIVAVLMDFVASGDLKKLQKDKYFKKWISMWLQRELEKEEISVGTDLWDDRYRGVETAFDPEELRLAENDFWNNYGLMDLRNDISIEKGDKFLDQYMDILNKDKKTIREFTFENREKVRNLILDETPFGWRVNFRNIMPGIVTKLQAHVGIGDIFSEDELEVGFTVTYPNSYHGKRALIAVKRKARKYLNKDDKYLAIFDDCDIIIR